MPCPCGRSAVDVQQQPASLATIGAGFGEGFEQAGCGMEIGRLAGRLMQALLAITGNGAVRAGGAYAHAVLAIDEMEKVAARQRVPQQGDA